MSKKTITLNHTAVEYIDDNGIKRKADFREVDAMRAFLANKAENTMSTAGKVVARVYRTSENGRALLGRFETSGDAEDFAEMMNENFNVLGFYKATVEYKD